MRLRTVVTASVVREPSIAHMCAACLTWPRDKGEEQPSWAQLILRACEVVEGTKAEWKIGMLHAQVPQCPILEWHYIDYKCWSGLLQARAAAAKRPLADAAPASSSKHPRKDESVKDLQVGWEIVLLFLPAWCPRFRPISPSLSLYLPTYLSLSLSLSPSRSMSLSAFPFRSLAPLPPSPSTSPCLSLSFSLFSLSVSFSLSFFLSLSLSR